MSNHNTKIEWTHIPGYKGETWNPIVGCSKVSPACTNCYAETMATRLANIQTTSYYGNVVEDGKWNGKTHFAEGLLNKPLEWKKPRAIFVGSMTDIFHETVLDEQIDQIIRVVLDCPQHIFLMLTKRADRMKEYFAKRYGELIDGADINDEVTCRLENNVISNLWLGVTAENQKEAEKRIPMLLETPAAIRFVSVEPMLEKINLDMLITENSSDRFRTIYSSLHGVKTLWDTKHLMAEESINKLDWVICGGESGKNARPLHPDWVRSLKEQCSEENVPFFFKQWGEWKHNKIGDELLPDRIGKKLAGKAIDGNESIEFPRSIR